MIKWKRWNWTHDIGSTNHSEDGLLVKPPDFLVVDSTSPPFNKSHPQELINDTSKGEIIKEVILEAFESCNATLFSLGALLVNANNMISWIQTHDWKIPINRSDLLAGACFAAARTGKDHIAVVQGGDCFVIWAFKKSSDVGYTINQTKRYEIRMQEMIDSLLEKNQGDQEKMWNEFYEPLMKSRLEHYNQPVKDGFCMLNGQVSFTSYWQRKVIPYKDLDFVIISTDGLIPFYLLEKDELEIATEVVKLYREGGLDKILQRTRKSEIERSRGYTKHCEAAGIAIEF